MASEADQLRELVAAMRDMGVTHYAKGDVVIDLGAAPRPESPPITDVQRRMAREKTKAFQDALLFASSEGFPVDEDEVSP
jgi:hypothetical protein